MFLSTSPIGLSEYVIIKSCFIYFFIPFTLTQEVTSVPLKKIVTCICIKEYLDK